MQYLHQKCGRQTHPVLTCSECGEPLRPEEVTPQLGPGLHALVERLQLEDEDLSDIPPLLRRSM